MKRPTLKLLRSAFSARGTVLFAVIPVAALVFAGAGSAAPAGSTDLKITKTDSPDPVKVGATLTYTIVVQNLGPIAASGITVTDQLPKGVDFVSATTTSGHCTHHGQNVTCAVGGIGTGTAADVTTPTVTIKVITRKVGTITNTASVKADQKDPVTSNNKATATTKVLAGTPTSATCGGATATIKGTAGNDQLTGTGRRDVIVAFAGNDTIASLAGNDLVCAGKGNDYVGAGSGADRVYGAAGKDRLVGQDGPDLLKGNTGNDVLKGNRGSDRLRGGPGFDRCRGGAGADSLRSCES